MKILLVCVMLQELRIAEPSAWSRRWQQPWMSPHRNDLGRTGRRMAEGAAWIGTGDQLAPFAFGLSPSPSSSSSSQEQRKRITTDAAEFGPTWTRGSARSSCSCESQHEVRDLGDGHYPRYLTAARCKSRICQSKLHSCRLLYYMVHVLGLREPTPSANEWYATDNSLPETPLPESLRHKWQLKPTMVAVACVPTTDGRRN